MALGRSLFIAIVMIVTLACRVAAAEDKDCRSQTMLPGNVNIVAPTADVPTDMARFSGAWNGPWNDAKGGGALCHALVVEEVFRNGFARVVYSHGTYEGWKVRQPDFWRATGRVVDGVLRIDLPTLARPKVAYRFSGDELAETFNGEPSARLTRVADVGQVGCRPSEAVASPPSSDTRDRVTAEDLLAPAYRGTGPVHNDYFMPIGPYRAPSHVFKGALTIPAGSLFTANRGCAGLAVPGSSFSAAFFTHGEYLVPVVRTILRPPGTIILSPRRVWSEPGDGGMSRASFPFVMINELGNQAHNGLATFLYDDSRVSALRVQVVQETAPWAKFDFWGQTPMTYYPGAIMNEDRLRAAFVAELQNETPIRPWSALPANAGLLEEFDGDARPLDISANGLVMDGAIYLRGCNTRYGPYPYCRHMRHGVFSVTKSLGAAVALLRLAQKYGEQVFDLKIKDYVTVTATHDGWDRVTFRDALNMATGIGDLSPQREPNDVAADEIKPKMFTWGAARTAKAKLDVAFTYGKYAWGPDEVVRYNSTHTFILSAAMDSVLKKREGPNAHLWDMVSNEVLQPIGILHARDGEKLEFQVQQRAARFVVTRRAGNPERY